MPRLGTGFTKVRGDDWNAELVLTFLRWVSSELPAVTVRVHDEGGYVLAGYIRFERGIPAIDREGLADWREYLRLHGFGEILARLVKAEQLAKRGVFLADVPVADYADHSDIAELGLTDIELSNKTLQDIAASFTMPWQTEWIKAGRR